jgi:hypothetical protein
MKSLFVYLSMAAFVLLTSDTIAQAQMVQVAPGYVRAPFVRVYSGPYGSRVRAPFVDVYTPFVPRGRFIREVPDDYSMPPELRQRRNLFFAARELDRSLGRYQTAASWRQYFALAPGMTLSADGLGEDAPPPLPAELIRILGRFDSASQNPEYGMITSLVAFQQARNQLAAYVAQAQAPGSTTAVPEELPLPSER